MVAIKLFSTIPSGLELHVVLLISFWISSVSS